ncbi:MAG: bifunctional phosphopantothenoylcysteine decarboxylase/phosphopantothenate--cysteine ligase CoaBC [Thermoplasmatota archaeon]
MHPSHDIRSTKSQFLEGKRIILGITGSIAAVECVKLSRELIRHGAEVHAVMTRKACEIVGPYSIEFGTGNPVITELTGAVEHVSMCGDVEGRADLVLVAPCTANTLGKMVHGIDDSPVTTFLTTAIGTGIPVLVVPAMHNTMYDHPKVQGNLATAREMGIRFVDPVIEEKKAKMATVPRIVEETIRMLGGDAMAGERVLVVTGATREPVDDMRVITNKASGRTGISLAVQAYRQGAEVLLLAGENVVDIPTHLQVMRFGSTDDLVRRIEILSNEWGDPSIAYFSAGISDYAPVKVEGKIPSGKKDMKLELEPTPKVIERFRKLFKDTFLVGYKAESLGDSAELLKRAFKRLKEVGMEGVVANDLSDVKDDSNLIFFLTPKKEAFKVRGKKDEIASFILEKTMHLKGKE